MPLSTEQKDVINGILAWVSAGDRPFVTLGGYAGTGKTTVIAALRYVLAQKRPNWKVAFAAYTGKATQVLAEKLKRTKLDLSKDSISTLHSLLYSPIADTQGQIAGWRRKDEVPFQLIVVDEASMVTQEIWRDLLRFQIPVLAVGDHGQLPPIGDSLSLMKAPDFTLTHIHRQAEESPIIQVATLAREQGFIPVENFGPGVRKINIQESDSQLMLEELYQQYKSDTLFLVGQNRTRVAINNAIRASMYRDLSTPEVGDVLICLRNNWQKGIFNGMQGKIQSVRPIAENDELQAYDAVIVDFSENELYSGRIAAQQFNADTTLDLGKKERTTLGELFDYGYALTVHKAQGSQSRRVVIIEERSRHMSDDDWKRWLYTAVTRAEEELIVFGNP